MASKAREGGEACWGRDRGDVLVLQLPVRALAADQDEQSAGAGVEGGEAQDEGRGLFPGWPLGADACVWQAAPCVRHEVGSEALYAHGATEGGEGGRCGGGVSFRERTSDRGHSG